MAETLFTPDARTKRQRYMALRAKLWSDRTSFDAHVREIGDWLLPRRTRFFAGDRNRGTKRNQNIINSTATLAHRTLKSGMHAGLTSPARPWLKLTTPDAALGELPHVKAWLHEVTQRMLTVFLQTNLYNALPIVYGDMGAFGTAAMSMLDDEKDLFRCYTYPWGSYAIGLDGRGLATTFVRDYELTVRQIVEQFGLKPDRKTIDWSCISDIVKNLWDRGQYEDAVQVTWIVTPNMDADPNRLEAKYLPWVSCHMEPGPNREDGRMLRESGFRSFPIFAPRWDITAEDSYGTACPGMDALGDVKALQIMERKGGQLLAKGVDPSLVGPASLAMRVPSLLPGGVTAVDERDGMKGLRPIHEVQLSALEQLEMKIQRVEYRIKRVFFEDLFLMLAQDDQRSSQPLTAREVTERHEEKFLVLGPVLERTDDELLNPIVDRAYLLMDAAGLIPDPPDEIQGVKLKVVFTSIMHEALKLVGVVGQDRYVQTAVSMAGAFPDVLSKVDTDQVMDNYADMLGVDPRINRSSEDAKAIRDKAAQAQHAAMQAEQAAKMGQGIAAAGKAPIAPDSALDRMMQNAPGAAA